MTQRRLLPFAGIALAALAAVASACSHGPPPDFAPDPGLVARIKKISIRAPQYACPGQSFAVYYDAYLDDGTRVQFATGYDKDHPPKLHVSFLDYDSFEATARGDGSWTVNSDPLQTVRTGFRLRAILKAKPSLRDSVRLSPDYSCMPHDFHFVGVSGARGAAGADGPAISVRVGIVRSPFYSKLLVSMITVQNDAPVFLFADASTIPPANWLTLDSKGGPGSPGRPGDAGSTGVAGQDACPGGAGGNGGNGGAGGGGAPGGRGGQITVMAPSENPYLAGIVAARAPGGQGGPGGKGGVGGKGGAGGKGQTDARGNKCTDGPNGNAGVDGQPGRDGQDGGWGPQPQIITVPLKDLFGPGAPPELIALMSTRR